MGASPLDMTPFPWSVLLKLGVVREAVPIWDSSSIPSHLQTCPAGTAWPSGDVSDVCSPTKPASACPAPPERLRLHSGWEVTSVTHGEGSNQPGEVLCAERGHSRRAHTIPGADGEQPCCSPPTALGNGACSTTAAWAQNDPEHRPGLRWLWDHLLPARATPHCFHTAQGYCIITTSV